MADSDPIIRNISDTALWAAAFRASESERPDALFRDHFARRLAGERGLRAQAEMPSGTRHTWAWVTRTWAFDQFIRECIANGADAVINLAAGLDARPYRLDLPAGLRWFEVDLPELIAYKEEVLRNEQPRCELVRIPLDLASAPARREIFARISAGISNALIITEGLVIYLEPEEVAALAQDLATIAGFRRWVLDLSSPAVLRILQKNIGSRLGEAGAPLKFGPKEGPSFFAPLGWRLGGMKLMLKTAAKLGRLPLRLRLLNYLPGSDGQQPWRPWSGVCLLENAPSPR